MYYIDINRNKFLNLYDYYKSNSVGKIENKDLLKSKRLIVFKNGKEVYSTKNIQSLYLYPLNILDYVKYAYEKKTLMYNILNIQNINSIEIDINIKNIEILIDEINLKNINSILQLSKILKSNNIYISYNFKTLNILKSDLEQLCLYGDYFKIKLEYFVNLSSYEEFINKIKEIKKMMDEKALIHLKGYLNLKQVEYYKNLVLDLKNIVDIIQISKELIPIDCKKNPLVELNIQKEIRNLEKNENFISVKDITTLYYPRFELDERNSHKCFVWYLKPYISGNFLLPCKVDKVVKNINEWKVKEIGEKNNINNSIKYGKQCKDCASIFENDILNEIISFYAKGYDFLLEIEEK